MCKILALRWRIPSSATLPSRPSRQSNLAQVRTGLHCARLVSLLSLVIKLTHLQHNLNRLTFPPLSHHNRQHINLDIHPNAASRRQLPLQLRRRHQREAPTETQQPLQTQTKKAVKVTNKLDPLRRFQLHLSHRRKQLVLLAKRESLHELQLNVSREREQIC